MYCKTLDFNFIDPKKAPQIPPINAIATYPYISGLKVIPLVNWAVSPDKELTKMNNALMAAVCFISVHFSNKRTGERIIPPPIPISPERKPIKAPTNNDKIMFGLFNSCTFIFPKNRKRTMGMINNKPNILL